MSDALSLPPMARPRVAAGMLVHDDQGRVLMVRPTYKDGWDIPGGYVEPDESPAQAAERELAEELNLRRTPGRLLVVDWAPHPAEGDKLLFVFDGGTLTDSEAATLRPDGDEIAEARYWRADDLDELAPARLVNRLRLALTALETGQTLYAERGASPVAA
jgi:8-oxo-dGTP diphosphatase